MQESASAGERTTFKADDISCLLHIANGRVSLCASLATRTRAL